jgi:hypothetical protein
MNTGEALKALIDAGWLTKEEANKIASKNEKQEKLKKVREVASRALTDYFNILMPDVSAEENKKFVDFLFKELERGLIPVKKPKDEDDEIMRFLKKIGVA